MIIFRLNTVVVKCAQYSLNGWEFQAVDIRVVLCQTLKRAKNNPDALRMKRFGKYV